MLASKQWRAHWMRSSHSVYLYILALLLALFLLQIGIAALHYCGFIGVEEAASSTLAPLPHLNGDLELVRPVSAAINDYDPQVGVAFAIPVGGRTERSASLASILDALLQGGALPANIYVFEDVLSRPDRRASPTVARVALERRVRVVSSRVDRSQPEDGTNFGIGLARHYHFFLDYLFAEPDTPNVIESVLREQELQRTKAFDFAVVIEDDLALSPDLVKYFFSMSRVMIADDTLYCVTSHQDNAFLGIHRDDEFDRSVNRATHLSPDDFDFRRGNHFMAPGWMTSRQVYLSIVRPKWLDVHLEYSHKSELHLRNGHWDRFFDSMIGDKDCIFPEIPRITHQGADGFTVSKRGQMELYSNLRLAALPVSVNYGDLSRMTKVGYIEQTESFLASSIRLNVLEEARRHRHAKLVYVVECDDDKDSEWNAVFEHFFGLIGVGGYGGFEGYVKVRGIFRGAVFVRWLSNLILLVGSYSPYMQHVAPLPMADDGLKIAELGCYVDSAERDLQHQVRHYTGRSLTPRRCLASCQLLGYRFAGLQRFECWCGNRYGAQGIAPAADCSSRCGTSDSLLGKLLGSSASSGTDVSERTNPMSCGGGWRNSVYHNEHPSGKSAHLTVLQAPSETSFVKGMPDETCDQACSNRGGATSRCDERYFPLIHRSCAQLAHVLSVNCDRCAEEDDPERGFATPAFDSHSSTCLLSRARYHRCNWQPPAGLIRACVCVT